MRSAAALCALQLALASAVFAQEAESVNLALPTENDTLFRGGGARFYQHIIRNFKGVRSTPWQGGQYGFVRNPIDTASGRVYSRFHEGIDIRPLRRDTRGEPLDEVRAIAAGEVVHVNRVPRYSNYGNYIVVEHRWNGSPYYSLYGHLRAITVEPGRAVERGAVLGIMGYTGTGLDQARAHLHLELNLLLSRQFESWYNHFIKDEPNRHGLYSGLNLTGIDIADFYLAQRRRPGLTVPQFLSREETAYRVLLPPSRNFDLHRRYPWLLSSSPDASPAAWEVSFSRSGIPLKVAPSERSVSEPTLSFVGTGRGNPSHFTRGVLTGSGKNVRFSETGARLMRLLVWPD